METKLALVFLVGAVPFICFDINNVSTVVIKYIGRREVKLEVYGKRKK